MLSELFRKEAQVVTEDEARDTARRTYSKNTSLRSADIGKAIGRSRQTVDSYRADLRAATQMGLDIKIFRTVKLDNQQDFQQKLFVHRKAAEIAEGYLFIVFR